jgi:hypothetical protein
MKTSSAVAIAAVLLALGSALYKCQVDNSAWQQADESLIRLRSGIQFETLIQLRSKLADADAALSYYTSKWRVLPVRHKDRFRLASRAISDLGLALDLASGGNQVLGADELRILSREHPDAVSLVPRNCSDGKLTASESSVSTVLVTLGRDLLENAIDGSKASAVLPAGMNTVAYIDTQIRQCQELQAETEEHQAKEKQEAESKYWASFRYRVDLSIVSAAAGSCTFYLSVDDAAVYKETLSADRPFEYGVHRTMELNGTQCNGAASPSDVIRVKVNERPYQPAWGAHRAVIVQDGVLPR